MRYEPETTDGSTYRYQWGWPFGCRVYVPAWRAAFKGLKSPVEEKAKDPVGPNMHIANLAWSLSKIIDCIQNEDDAEIRGLLHVVAINICDRIQIVCNPRYGVK